MTSDVKSKTGNQSQNYVAASCNLGGENELVLKIYLNSENVDVDKSQLYEMLSDFPELHATFDEFAKIVADKLGCLQGDQTWWYDKPIRKPGTSETVRAL